MIETVSNLKTRLISLRMWSIKYKGTPRSLEISSTRWIKEYPFPTVKCRSYEAKKEFT